MTTSANGKSEPAASWWHTLLVLLLLGIASVASAYQQGLPNAHLPGMTARLSSYFTVLFEEWFVIFVIWLWLRRQRLSMRSLVAGGWPTLGSFLKDIALAVGFLVVAVPLLGLLSYYFGGSADTTLVNITPKTRLELVVWLGTAATAGFCEELTFRGYLTRQFKTWTGSPVSAIVLQAIIFGLAHGYYYKTMTMGVVMLEGLLLGLLAYWRKSLRPGMLAHGLQDGIGGIVAFLS